MRKLLEELKKFIATATPKELDQAWKKVEQFKEVLKNNILQGPLFSNPTVQFAGGAAEAYKKITEC